MAANRLEIHFSRSACQVILLYFQYKFRVEQFPGFHSSSFQVQKKDWFIFKNKIYQHIWTLRYFFYSLLFGHMLVLTHRSFVWVIALKCFQRMAFQAGMCKCDAWLASNQQSFQSCQLQWKSASSSSDIWTRITLVGGWNA